MAEMGSGNSLELVGRIPLSLGRLGYTLRKISENQTKTSLSLVYGWIVQQARWQLETFAMD